MSQVPEIKLGMVILSNCINRLPDTLAYRIIDDYLGIKSRDWSRIFLQWYQESEEKDRQRWLEILRACETGPCTGEVKLQDYAGFYHCPMYGVARVILQEGRLVLDLLPAPVFVSDLSHLHYDTFVLKLRNTLSFVARGPGTVQFVRDKLGKVKEMKLDIPNHDFWFDKLEFRKKSLDQ